MRSATDAPVGQAAADAVAGLDPPFDGGAAFRRDARVDCARLVAQRRDQRLTKPQHERRGQAPTLRLVDEPGQAVARLGLAAGFEAER